MKKAKTGRPTKYTEDLGREICRRMTDGESVRAMAEDDSMPSRSSIMNWAVDPDHPFAAMYDRARRIRAEALIDEIIAIADEDGETNRDRLRVDTRKWFASKVAPKLYGDRVNISADVKQTVTAESLLAEGMALGLSEEEIFGRKRRLQ